jgi:hypothetical protein
VLPNVGIGKGDLLKSSIEFPSLKAKNRDDDQNLDFWGELNLLALKNEPGWPIGCA